ncbi:MAG: iron complex outerrane recepter protein, partial [Verrucomicrobiota bacterium]
VNIKRWHDYRGAEAKFEYGNTTDRDSGSINTALTFGVGDGKTNISGTVIPSAGGNQFASAPNGTNGLAPANAYLYGAGRPRSGPNGFNFNEFSLSFPSSERYGGYVAMDHKIFGDQLVIYADGMYQDVKTHNELAAPATGNFQSPGFTTLAIPPRVANPAGTTPFGGPTYAETGVTPGAFNPFNPFNQIISGGTRARLAEFGNRLFDNESEAWLGTIGFRGDKLFNGTWGYDTAFRYSEIQNTTTGTQVSISRFNRILNQADPIFNPTSPEYIGTRVAFNPFGDFRVPIPSNAASIEFARVHPRDLDTSKLATVDATIYTTALFDLPAGGIGFALGGQFRRETLDENPDQLNISGDISGNSSIATAHGGRKSYAIFVETSIPIFSEKNAVTGFHALDVNAAGRYEAFLNNNTSVAVPKIGVRWQPVDDTLTIRFTWGLGFREPSLEELYSAPISDIQPSHDPKNGGAFEPETTTLIQSTPDLQPEDSETFSGGIVWTPKFVPGLTLSTDLWQIERTGVVQSAFLDAVLARELAGTLLPGERVERLPDGTITRIIVSNRNEASQKANGIDFGMQYQYPSTFGTFTLITQVTYLNSFEVQRVEGGITEQLAGVTTDPGQSQEGYYRWRGNTSIDWTWKGFDLLGRVRLISGFIEQDPDLVTRNVDRRWLFDLQASYDFSALVHETSESPSTSKDSKATVTTSASGKLSFWDTLLKGTTFTIGCNNVFDKDPPFASGQGGNSVGYPGFTYDATGRFYYVRLTKKF